MRSPEALRRASSNFRKRNLAAGRCSKCHAPAATSRKDGRVLTLCKKHLAYARERQRAIYARLKALGN